MSLSSHAVTCHYVAINLLKQRKLQSSNKKNQKDIILPSKASWRNTDLLSNSYIFSLHVTFQSLGGELESSTTSVFHVCYKYCQEKPRFKTTLFSDTCKSPLRLMIYPRSQSPFYRARATTDFSHDGILIEQMNLWMHIITTGTN